MCMIIMMMICNGNAKFEDQIATKILANKRILNILQTKN